MTERPPAGQNLVSQKMGLSEWSYHNDYNPAPRQKMKHVDLTKRFQELNIEVELGFTAEQTAREVQRCLNCDIETVFTPKRASSATPASISARCCASPSRAMATKTKLQQRLSAPAINPDQALYASAPLPQTGRLMLKDEDLASTAACAPSAVPPRRGTCRNSNSNIHYAGSMDTRATCVAA